MGYPVVLALPMGNSADLRIKMPLELPEIQLMIIGLVLTVK